MFIKRLSQILVSMILTLVTCQCNIVLSVQDITPPVLTYFDFSPTTIDITNNSATVSVTATATDDHPVWFVAVFIGSLR